MKNTTSSTASTDSRLNEAADVWRVMLKDVYDFKQNVHAPGLKELFDNSSLICMYDNQPNPPGQCAADVWRVMLKDVHDLKEPCMRLN